MAALVVIAAIVAAILFWPRDESNSPDDEALRKERKRELVRAKLAFENRNYDDAALRAQKILNRDPDHPAARLLLAKSLEAQGAIKEAAENYARVPAGHPPDSTEAAWRHGHLLLMKLHRPAAAERSYLKARSEDKFALPLNTGLTLLYGFTRQWWLAIQTELAIIRSGQHETANLYSIAQGTDARDDSLRLELFRRKAPSDPLVRLAVAHKAIEEQKYAAALKELRTALDESPDLAQARVWEGEIYLETGRTTEFTAWSRRLTRAEEAHPAVWELRGAWAKRHKQQESALRCYCEAVSRDPNSVQALYQISQILSRMNRSDQAAPFLKRAADLDRYINVAKTATADANLDAKRQAAEIAESLGNDWEAFGWAVLATRHPDRPRWAEEMIARLRPQLKTRTLTRTRPGFNPVDRFDYRRFPLPSISSGGHPSIAKGGGKRLDRFSFEEAQSSAGVAFRYFNASRDVSKGMTYMYETMGGGVGVIDIDGDLRPDLYFTQGCRWPVNERSFEHLDRVFINRGDNGFEDVTVPCRIRENRFSHGVAVGDFNSDGLPDLLIGNIGRNRLYRNNGDGTFSDVSDDAGLTRDAWSTSCALADLNGDGYPEAYVVNYLGGANVFTKACGQTNSNICGPQEFPSENDRLHWNTGDGTFSDVTKQAGIVREKGAGLGIVVARRGKLRLPGVFIANDMTPNFYFENRTPEPGQSPKFIEEASPRGLAYSDRGKAQACMGVAADDADGDGEIDLFVTNFHLESNALYLHWKQGIYRDAAMSHGIRQPSLQKLGFGTQFLDADLDGWPDLVVANGHIDDHSRDRRTEYQMRPQFLSNVGKGRFKEVDTPSLGEYFRRKLLGRGLARLDWDGDGREEFAVSHLDAPAALLRNTTARPGGYLALHLRGVQSNRDAIGAVVRVRIGDRVITRQLTAGDGFLASNERVLIFGLGKATSVESITIDWPSGEVDQFQRTAANSRWLAVEGTKRLLPAPPR